MTILIMRAKSTMCEYCYIYFTFPLLLNVCKRSQNAFYSNTKNYNLILNKN